LEENEVALDRRHLAGRGSRGGYRAACSSQGAELISDESDARHCRIDVDRLGLFPLLGHASSPFSDEIMVLIEAAGIGCFGFSLLILSRIRDRRPKTGGL
jgi:hypothetical protein